jgi:type III pantothenate kinase
MLLALDIGNTNIVAGVFNNDQLIAQWRLSSGERTADELAAFFKIAFDSHDLNFHDVRGVAISSVVPALTPQAALLAQEYFRVQPLIVGHDLDIGLRNDYGDPRAVGADRLVNALAAWTKYSCACVIADFGTATTVDAVSSDGVYLGGAIAPGLQISTDALFQAAARLPRVELQPPSDGKTLARHTTASMQAGLVYGYAGLTSELVRRCRQELVEIEGEKARKCGRTEKDTLVDMPTKVLATGGLASLIAPLVPEIEHVEPELALEGLRLIWQRHHKK